MRAITNPTEKSIIGIPIHSNVEDEQLLDLESESESERERELELELGAAEPFADASCNNTAYE